MLTPRYSREHPCRYGLVRSPSRLGSTESNLGVKHEAGGWSFGLSAWERRFCGVVLAVNAVLALGIAVLKLATGMDLNILMKDVVLLAGLPSYAGSYQFISILSYAASTSVSFFVAAAYSSASRPDPIRRLLVLSGGYTAFACIDDLFLLHENGFYVGLPERGVIALHAALMAWVVLTAWRLGPRTPWPILWASVAAMALAVLLDLPGFHFPGQVPAEETFETLGAALLASYVILTAYRLLAPRLAVVPGGA